MLLITGSKGQLGTCLTARLPQAIGVDIDVLDICDFVALKKFTDENNIDCIVNCAAYTAVDKAEEEPELAKKINADAVLNLAKTGAKVIHISTDYVFNGKSSTPYSESDAPSPASVYGRTKLDGENALFENAKSAFVIRTSWLYSNYGNNFVKTMRRLGAERESLNVVFDQIGTPTFADDLADAIVKILPLLKDGCKELFHFSNEGVCSWYDFARKIMELSSLSCKVSPIESKDYPTKACRPNYSVLNKSKIKNFAGLEIPHWEESLKKCISRF